MKNLIYKSAAFAMAFIALFLVSANAAFAQDSTIKEIKDAIPKHEEIITNRCDGAKITIEVDFDSFGGSKENLEHVPYQGLEEIAYGVGRYCADSNNPNKINPIKVGHIKKINKILIKFVKDPKDKKVYVDGTTIVIEEAFGVGYGTFGQAEIAEKLGEAFRKKK